MSEAARWQARLQAVDCSEAERAAFRCWQQQHRSHAEAFQAVESVSRKLDAAAADPRLQALADEAFAAYEVPQPARRRWVVPATLAASIAIAAVALRFWIDPSATPATQTYATAAAERRTMTLSDGSNVAMDVGTRLSVRMSAARREIELLSGRALFEVAHDSSRPFSVTAAGSRTTALGTRFQVQRRDEHIVVTLAEGSIEVDAAAAGGGAPGLQVRLSPGEQLSIDEHTAALDKTAVDPQIATSWAQGRHVFRSTRLADALDEINQYAVKKVRLGDPSLADLQVGGNFIAGDSEQIVAAFAAVLPLSIVASGEHEIILFRRYLDGAPSAAASLATSSASTTGRVSGE